ncbi:8025_t:CDS:2, partial [Cetraspora pellucida]
INVPVPKNITVKQFYKDLVVRKIGSKNYLNNKDHLQLDRIECEETKCSIIKQIVLFC